MRKAYNYKALGQRVLAVAVVNYRDDAKSEVFDWAAYIDAVPGESHDNEYIKVSEYGSKLSPELGLFLFPEYDPESYRH